MLFGAHVSIAGGFAKAPQRAADLGCEVFQMFSRSPRGGNPPPITKAIAAEFRDACKRYEQERVYIHTPYFINLASKNAVIRKNSIRMIREELERGTVLGARAIMTHLGSARDYLSDVIINLLKQKKPLTSSQQDVFTQGKKDGRTAVIEGLKAALKGYRGSCQFLIEISAGAGANIGGTFEDLAVILQQLPATVGICLDTQHAFAAGYDWRGVSGVEKVVSKFDELIGLDRLVASHCNDSKTELGSGVDRHEHLGAGLLGVETFKKIVHNKKLQHVDLICETPTEEGMKHDISLLKKYRSE